ncbi:histidine phosphatase family protein [Pseudooceanicola sediminis]|uniref:Histidine phosphatase family protein n=1 Tax=Pseudooceanicola sediminis TaxID=2211117 RepID=A0A399J2F3_9RHOB|nr:histidine phosphatase family protein [Pseudooceanicola sediminis]KAA2314515.1 histidine phosphatase family protein [Puniceibacterium sp. HSS470]RII39490.1 histidine phosphatase family protein [Pseudooceanicola sediminis]|tara:strand:+ start:62230 stop:62724 length:495 start_codon:yes stop_codon:yes gene_type:complete
MTKRLILMRHAKSSWALSGQPDHDRPLNERGAKSAAALGSWLHTRGYEADEALVSTARRTRETFSALKSAANPQFTATLYNAGPAAIMAALRQASGACVLLIAHNPGMCDFANRLITSRPAHPRFEDFPTGATLVADCPVPDWSVLAFNQAITVDFIVPRDLID